MATPGNPYDIQSITEWHEISVIKTFWEASQNHPAADYDFFALILRSRAQIVSPCIFVVYDVSLPIALLVARIERTAFPIRFGYGTIASIPVSKLVIIEGGFIGNTTDAVWSRLLDFIDTFIKRRNISVASFENVRIDSSQRQLMHARYGRFRLSPLHQSAKHWILRLPDSWIAFMNGRSKKRRYWLNRLPKVLDRDFPNSWNIIQYTSATEAATFAEMAETVARQTYHRGLGVGFQNDPETKSRMALEAIHGRFRGYILFIADVPRAFWYCFTYRNILYLTSTGFDPLFRTYELGTVLLLKIFASHCGSSVGVVDFGLGDAGYKQRFGTECFSETSFLLFSDSPRGLALNLAHRVASTVQVFLIKVLEMIHLKDRLKTFWRRHRQSSGPPIAENEGAINSKPDASETDD